MDFDKYHIVAILKKHGYELDREIGSGAFGFCWIVKSLKFKIDYVCKCMRSIESENSSAIDQFNREIYSLMHINHKNIVKIYDYFTEDGYLFNIIEYCENGSLTDFLKNKVQNLTGNYYSCNYSQARSYMSDILLALSYCHSKKITHNDIKPSNIVLDKFGRAKLCDFGFSRLVSEIGSLDQNQGSSSEGAVETSNSTSQKPKQSQRPLNPVAGSLPFMSPQLLQCSMTNSGTFNRYSADVWAFGVTAYLILTLRYPFTGKTNKEMLKSQIRGLNIHFPDEEETIDYSKFNIFSKIPPDIPDDIMEVLQKSLTYNEEERPTASELLGLLKKESQSSLPSLPPLSMRPGSFGPLRTNMRNIGESFHIKDKMNIRSGVGFHTSLVVPHVCILKNKDNNLY